MASAKKHTTSILAKTWINIYFLMLVELGSICLIPFPSHGFGLVPQLSVMGLTLIAFTFFFGVIARAMTLPWRSRILMLCLFFAGLWCSFQINDWLDKKLRIRAVNEAMLAFEAVRAGKKQYTTSSVQADVAEVLQSKSSKATLCNYVTFYRRYDFRVTDTNRESVMLAFFANDTPYLFVYKDNNTCYLTDASPKAAP